MRIIKVGSQEEFAALSSELLLAEMLKPQQRVNLAITGGKTPIDTYGKLSEKVKGREYYKHVHYYNFDEIPFKETPREGITISDLRALYFEPAQIAAEQIHKLDEHNYAGQDQRIWEAGGLDAILMGIGADGHFCGNLPGTTKFGDWTSRVDCSPAMKDLLAGMYENKADVPDYYVTMGPRSVMAAKHLILFANGAGKAEIVKRFVNDPVSEEVPVTLLKLHPNVTLLVDEAAGQFLDS